MTVSGTLFVQLTVSGLHAEAWSGVVRNDRLLGARPIHLTALITPDDHQVEGGRQLVSTNRFSQGSLSGKT